MSLYQAAMAGNPHAECDAIEAQAAAIEQMRTEAIDYERAILRREVAMKPGAAEKLINDWCPDPEAWLSILFRTYARGTITGSPKTADYTVGMMIDKWMDELLQQAAERAVK